MVLLDNMTPLSGDTGGSADMSEYLHERLE
jgi:hypothetical protein